MSRFFKRDSQLKGEKKKKVIISQTTTEKPVKISVQISLGASRGENPWNHGNPQVTSKCHVHTYVWLTAWYFLESLLSCLLHTTCDAAW